jgi:hypothetical protein
MTGWLAGWLWLLVAAGWWLVAVGWLAGYWLASWVVDGCLHGWLSELSDLKGTSGFEFGPRAGAFLLQVKVRAACSGFVLEVLMNCELESRAGTFLLQVGFGQRIRAACS